jgi:hypothetical protein
MKAKLLTPEVRARMGLSSLDAHIAEQSAASAEYRAGSELADAVEWETRSPRNRFGLGLPQMFENLFALGHPVAVSKMADALIASGLKRRSVVTLSLHHNQHRVVVVARVMGRSKTKSVVAEVGYATCDIPLKALFASPVSSVPTQSVFEGAEGLIGFQYSDANWPSIVKSVEALNISL